MPSPTAPNFASLPPRPPTPPKDSISKDVDDALRFLEEGHRSPTKELRDIRSKIIVGTPPSHSPTTSQQGSGAGKKVDFSPWPIYHNPPQTGQHISLRPQITKQPSYSRPNKPLKSILKLANTPSPLTPDDLENRLGYFSPEKPESFEKMLESVLHQLASPNRSARLDAYVALNGSLKAYEGMPDPRAIAARIPLLTQFLSRDMVWKDPNGLLDTNIVSQSLQLACAILFNPQTSQALDDDFRAFLIDRSIFILEQTEISKLIVKTHLYLLSHQRVYTGVLTALRIEKILNALKTLDCSGNSAITARLIIYQRLIEQAAVVMLNRMSDWIENILHGLLSSNKDIRHRAIEACSRAGSVLGTYQQASKTLNQVLETECEEGGRTFGDYFNGELNLLITSEDIGPDVPRIWASVILLFRCKRRPIHKWPKFREWLVTIQKCFNSSDLAIKQQASLAWNKLVFAVMPDSTTTEICRSMLRVPIIASLEKTGFDKQSQQIRQFALDSYYNLLHYALRPGLSHQELDMAWDMYVQPVLKKVFRSSTFGPRQACQIMIGLLNKTNGLWNINAAMETGAIKPEELPRLDIRWVRSRLHRVLKLFEPVLISALNTTEAIPFFDESWTMLWQTVAEAGSQEVRTSNELKDALAEVTNLFGRVWRLGLKLQSQADSKSWSRNFQHYLKVTVQSLGSGPFVEDILSESKTKGGEVEATPTPSNRLSKGHGDTHSPLVFLFSLYYEPPPRIRTDDSYRSSASWLIQFLTAAKVSAIERLQILTQVIQHCPQLSAGNTSVKISQLLWAVAARKAAEILTAPDLVSTHETRNVGVAIRHAMTILAKGLQLSALNEVNPETIVNLFNAMCDAAHRCGGNGAVILAVIEPTTVVLMDNLDALRIAVTSQLTIRLLERSKWPKDRLVLDNARKALYNLSSEPMRGVGFEPFKVLFSLVSATSQQLYRQGFQQATHDVPLALLNALVAFLHDCPPLSFLSAMLHLQNGLAVWFQDSDRQVFPLPEASSKTVSEKLSRQTALIASRQVTPLWSKVLETIRRTTRYDSAMLQSVDLLMIGGLMSPSRDIVNSTILFWNDTFGSQIILEYPERLLPVLRARMDQTEISAPCLPARTEAEPVVTLPTFEYSQPEIFSSPTLSVLKPQTRALLGRLYESPKNTQNLATDRESRSENDSTTKPRLRHDDSQIAFEPITSSPSPYEVASQLLTDHQKEIRDEQQANAQMFTDISSSPNEQSASLTRNIPTALDFSDDSRHADEIMIETPTGPADGNLMSDDLPSSPTPRATDRPVAIDEYGDLEMDPPSSPPRAADGEWNIRRGPLFGPANTSSDVMKDIQDLGVGTVNLSLPQASTDHKPDTQRPVGIALDDVSSDIPSPKEVPDEQETASNITVDTPKETISEVKDSQDDPAQSQQTKGSENVADSHSQASQRETRKRKRASTSNITNTRRTEPSPPQPPPSVLTVSHQAPDSDSADDEIVVVPRDIPSVVTRLTDEVTQIAPSPAERRSGRKRKSDTSQTSQQSASPGPETRLKRSASVLSNNSSSKRVASAVVEDSPATSKVRRQQKTADVKMAKQAQSLVQTRQGAKRQLSAVVIPETAGRHSNARKRVRDEEGSSEEEEEGSTGGSDAIDADTQLTQEHSAAIQGRQIAQPHSIIARLRGVLADCKKMIFGSQEERDLDDVLFELRREVHEASRRGRDL